MEAPREVGFLWLCQMRRAPYPYDWLDNFGRRSPRRADPSLTDLAVGQSFMTIFELTDFTDSESLTLRTKAGRPTRIFGAITLHYRVETITGSRSQLVAALWMPPIGITITKLSQSFIYQLQGGSVVATKSCVTSSVNFNIAVALSEDTSCWIQNSHGICESTWHGNILFRGSGVRFDKIQHLEVDARGVYSKWLVNE